MGRKRGQTDREGERQKRGRYIEREMGETKGGKRGERQTEGEEGSNRKGEKWGDIERGRRDRKVERKGRDRKRVEAHND